MSILHHFKGPADPTGCILGVRLVCSVSQKIAQSLKSSLEAGLLPESSSLGFFCIVTHVDIPK